MLRSKSISYSHSIWFIFLSLALIWLNRLSSLPVNLVVICLGAYQLGSAIVYGITFWLYKPIRVKGGWTLFMGCAFKRWAWSSNCLGTWFRWALPIYPLGAYLVLLGISNIRDGILFDKDQQGQELKRRFRISLPVIFAALSLLRS